MEYAVHDVIKQNFAHYSTKEQVLISQAYIIASELLQGISRGNGCAFIEHPLNVAKIVAHEIGLQAECVVAVFLHEAQRMSDGVNIQNKLFTEDIYTMVEGLNKISSIKPKDTKLEAESYKKLIVQYSTDPRVVVIKIADRLEVMRNLAIFPKLSKERKLIETQFLYLPLAHQLGLYNIKSELEDIFLKYSEPEFYRLITNKLKAGEKDRKALTDNFIEPLKKKLSDEGIHYKLKIRTKSAYSIYKKMLKQKVSFEGVYDIFAIRFIIDCPAESAVEKDLCWKVYSYVTEEYEADTKRLRDWITNPKSNGYESLHITIKNKQSVYLEVQIRSKRMDDIAENGNASHWSYKGIKREESISNWLSSVRSILESKAKIDYENLDSKVASEVFVFTPSGELRILPAGATILDFAFDIHSGLGCKCTGGKVNGKVVSIKEKLKTGDVIEILSSKNQKPSQDWLNHVVISKARNKIKQIIKENEYKKAADGRELLERRLKNWKLDFPDLLISEFLKKHHYSTESAFYAAIGEGNLDINLVKNFILKYGESAASTLNSVATIDVKEKVWKGEAGGDDILMINAKDLKSLDYKMALCCNPVFGDDVFGFVTRTSGIKIHRITCPNAYRLLNNYPYRVQKVKWADSISASSFQANLKITTMIDGGISNKIMEIVMAFKASIRAFNINENQRAGTYDISLKLAVPSNMELDKIISRLRNTKDILKVTRN